MHRGGCEQFQAGMMMVVVIPGEGVLAETARVLDGTETVRVVRPVLHGFEVRFRKRVVIGDVRPAVPGTPGRLNAT